MRANALRFACILHLTNGNIAPSLHRQHMRQVFYRTHGILLEIKEKPEEDMEFSAPKVQPKQKTRKQIQKKETKTQRLCAQRKQR